MSGPSRSFPQSAQSGHVIQDEGTPLPAQANLDFQGAGVTAADGSGKTVITIPGGGSASDASTTVKGIIKTSVAPASAGSPIAVGDNDKRVQPQLIGTAAGNLGTTQTVDFASVAQETWLVGVLNGNLAVTVSNPVAGSRLKVLALQDGTGSRTLTIAETAVTIPTTATTGLAMVTVDWIDATNFRVESAGVYTESDPNAVLKSLVDAKGDLLVGSADNTVIRKAIGSDGQVLTADAASAGGLKWAASAGGGGGAAGVHPAAVYGLKTWTFDLYSADDSVNGNGGVIMTATIVVPYDTTVTGMAVYIDVAGAGLTTAYGALWNIAGTTRLAKTASQTTNWQSIGYKTPAFTGAPISLTAGTYIAAVMAGGTTAAGFRSKLASSVAILNAGTVDPAFRGANLFPADDTTATLSGLTGAAKAPWVGLY